MIRTSVIIKLYSYCNLIVFILQLIIHDLSFFFLTILWSNYHSTQWYEHTMRKNKLNRISIVVVVFSFMKTTSHYNYLPTRLIFKSYKTHFFHFYFSIVLKCLKSPYERVKSIKFNTIIYLIFSKNRRNERG